jgi:hypothetical protein
VKASLLEQQGKVCNSPQDIAISLVGELLALAYGLVEQQDIEGSSPQDKSIA